jgi:prevent-host-death family protein
MKEGAQLTSVTIHQAKSQLSKLIKQACQGEEIIIARGKFPVARLVPIGKIRARRKPGALRGKLHVGTKFFEPLPAEELAAWGQSDATAD